MSDESALPRLGLLRQMSDRVVFEGLVREGPATRAELSVKAGLSKPTVSQAVHRLAGAGLIEVAGRQTGRRGGVGTIYRVSRAAGVVLAVRVDQSGISARAVDLSGERVAEHSVSGLFAGRTDLGDGVRDAVLTIRAAMPSVVMIRSAVVSVASPVNPRTNEVVPMPDSPFPEAVLRPAELLADLVDGPVLVDNDVNLAALAERYEGAATACDTFVYVFVGAGLGAAVYLGNAIVRGSHGLAGEIGWLRTSVGTSAATLARHVATASLFGSTPVIDIDAALSTLSGVDSPARAELVGRLGESVAYATTALCAAVDPELIVLGGPLGSLPVISDAVADALRRSWPRAITLCRGHLGKDAALLGAARLGLAAAREAALAALEPG